MDKHKCWVKNVISNFNPTSTFTFNYIFFNCIFNPTFGFPYLTQIWVETTQHFLECVLRNTGMNLIGSCWSSNAL